MPRTAHTDFRPLMSIILLAFTLTLPLTSSAQTTQSDALTQLTQKANAGDPQAMYELGMDYQRGNLVERNLTTVLQWLEKPPQADNEHSMNRLGRIFFW